MGSDVVSLHRSGVSVVLGMRRNALPTVLHWGADLGEGHLDALVTVTEPPVPHSALDTSTRVGLLPEYADGFAGRPGLQVLRAGRGTSWSPRFRDVHVDVEASKAAVHATDPDTGLGLTSNLVLEASGLLRMRHRIINLAHDPVWVLALNTVLPVPVRAAEVLDLTGRWSRERSPQRRPFYDGAVVRESRRGRTGHDASLLMAAGTAGFSFETGQVWAVHVAWSGDHVTYAERLPEGHSVLGGGELLGPGEIELAPGESYDSPWLLASWSDAGLNGVSARWHDWLRSRPSHPQRPRPVVLNTWEAVYFDHDLIRLRELAAHAAAVGVERFVLDDGWFRGRRDDLRALGDWTVDTETWPQGLHPLAERVRDLGMEFGLWVEPEMINPDSELARAHPEWMLRGRETLPPSWRHQQVVDLALPPAYAFIRDALLALLDEYDIAFLKWDHNRDLIDVAHGGRPAVHRQTLAFYAMLEELKRAQPGLEIESCASGGGRVDLEVLQRTQRIWASDCNDPLERQLIQRWTGMLVPPELIGCHVGAPTSHTTGRTHTLGFRASTAFFGHFGVEWDLTRASDVDRAELAEWIALHKRERELLHCGRMVVADSADPSMTVHGVVAIDAATAVFAVTSLATSTGSVPAPIRLPGLDPDRTYQVETIGQPPLYSAPPAGWVGADPIEVGGRILLLVGLAVPALRPETTLLLKVTAIP
ncbi:MAG: alpha-galactosidase [Nocardioidaceae bacterium]|nr:alpha-galactosidase [Nocardioidaceae bacterium]